MKIMFGLLNQIQRTEHIVKVLSRLLEHDPVLSRDDVAQSLLISSFIKPFLQKRSKVDDPADPLLTFAIDSVFPRTMDVLGEKAPHITEMLQRIQASLNLYILFKAKFKEHPKVKNLQSSI